MNENIEIYIKISQYFLSKGPTRFIISYVWKIYSLKDNIIYTEII